ncbi:hypothetical protein FI667_g13228, partial [Globisporangium splendens]
MRKYNACKIETSLNPTENEQRPKQQLKDASDYSAAGHMARLSLRKLTLFALNLASTLLTLFTGLRENPLIVFVTGRYDLIQARTRDGSLNYRIVPDDLIEIDKLTDLEEVGKTYRFFSVPTRGPNNLGSDRSNCLKLNSMNVSSLNIYYEDIYGKSNWRNQIYTFSTSAPKCDVANFKQDWMKTCISSRDNNETLCHQYILDNFATLQGNRLIRKATKTNSGSDGVPFLKCRGRPPRTFGFTADLVLHQSYWAGGTYYVLFLTSDCLAIPTVRTPDWEWGLYEIKAVDKVTRVVGAIDNYGWFAKVVTFCYGIVSITMILRGIFVAIVQSRNVFYIPTVKRFLNERRVLKYIFPSMMAARLLPGGEDNATIRFKGTLFMASDVWMNSWIYIVFSILDALVNMRMTYYVFQMGTWMLSKKMNIENFIFMCSALTRLTWILCLVHTLIRWGLKVLVRSLGSLKCVRPSSREKLEWYIDASALFVSYKIYSLLLFVFLYILLKTLGATTFMVRQGAKRGVFGGSPNIAQFWESELACDLSVFIPILIAAGYAANNGVIKLIQDRYMVVGWDVFVVMESLGIDPLKPELLVDNNVVSTSCSLGALLQQLYTSGPSGHVNLAGDYIFVSGGFTREPTMFHYPVKQAMSMGLGKGKHSGVTSNRYSVNTVPVGSVAASEREHSDTDAGEMVMKRRKAAKSLFDRRLSISTDGRFGRILLVDQNEPGKVAKDLKSSLTEYVVRAVPLKANWPFTACMNVLLCKCRRLALLGLNLASTVLTLFTGLRENPLVVFTTGRYDRMRSRLREGAINYEIIRPDLIRSNQLVDLVEVGNSYRFFSAPTRTKKNVNEDRSTCLRVNSINATVINICYDDFWGHAPRRTQMNLHSISAANCKVINFKPAYVKKCIEMRAGNTTQCHEYMLEDFETLAKNRLIQMGVESDYGTAGAPYLKCLGRPEKKFRYKTDMMVHQNYWAGGSNYILFHTSDCMALPLVRDAGWEYGLFQVQPVDDASVVVGAIDNDSYTVATVTLLYVVISISLILRGIFVIIAQSRELLYIPKSQRFLREQKHLQYFAPFMSILTSFPQDETSVIRFKGSVLMGSDVWMNHWLYVFISIVDSVVDARLTYIIFQTGTWMLRQKVNMENFIFLCSALTKMTWLMCCLHSLIRGFLKVVVRGLKSFKVVRPVMREQLEWNAVMQLLQKRCFFVGWDSMVAMEALGIDPLNPQLVENGVAVTNCTLGSLLRQLHVSGPSGLVSFAGDYVFEDGGFTKPALDFRYPIKRALTLGLCKTARASGTSRRYSVTDDRIIKAKSQESIRPGDKMTTSLFDRNLLIYPHGRYDKVLLVDESNPGKVQKAVDTGLTEFVVQDALSFMTILDIKPLMGNEKKLRIRQISRPVQRSLCWLDSRHARLHRIL